MKKLIFPLTIILLLSGCSTFTYIKSDSPIVVSAIEKNNGKCIAEAYAMDNRNKPSYVYFEASCDFQVGDTIWLKK